MTIYLALQSTYSVIEVGIFQENAQIDSTSIDKFKASQDLIPVINNLLTKNKYDLSHLSFIAVNQGPAPFTTLRVTIATANGIGFASHIPLVGVDALHTLLSLPTHKNTIVMLNAFNHDLYVGMKYNDVVETGCFKALPFLQDLAQKNGEAPIEFMGNAVPLYAPIIQELFNKQAHITYPLIEYPTLEQIAHAAFTRWQEKEQISYQLFPLYLKSAAPL